MLILHAIITENSNDLRAFETCISKINLKVDYMIVKLKEIILK